MRYGRPLALVAALLVAGHVLAAGVGFAGLVVTAAAVVTGVVCLLAIALGIGVGTADAGPRTPYW